MSSRSGLAFDLNAAFAVFDRQDSGCVSYGVEVDGTRYFVKTATNAAAEASLRRALRFHELVQHPTILAPIETREQGGGPVLIYPWLSGRVLNHATTTGSDRSALGQFRKRPLEEVERALTAILDAHRSIADAGLVAVDLYDGCFLYDFDKGAMALIDLDEYRPGPFVLGADRLPGSRRYMAPEESTRGSTIDERTTVFNLGRTIAELLDDSREDRITPQRRELIAAATAPNPDERPSTIRSLQRAWAKTNQASI